MSGRPAIVAVDGTYSYAELDVASRCVAAALLGGDSDLQQARVAFLVPPSGAYAASQRGIARLRSEPMLAVAANSAAAKALNMTSVP